MIKFMLRYLLAFAVEAVIALVVSGLAYAIVPTDLFHTAYSGFSPAFYVGVIAILVLVPFAYAYDRYERDQWWEQLISLLAQNK